MGQDLHEIVRAEIDSFGAQLKQELAQYIGMLNYQKPQLENFELGAPVCSAPVVAEGFPHRWFDPWNWFVSSETWYVYVRHAAVYDVWSGKYVEAVDNAFPVAPDQKIWVYGEIDHASPEVLTLKATTTEANADSDQEGGVQRWKAFEFERVADGAIKINRDWIHGVVTWSPYGH